jgi:hypothetical protein
MGLPIRAEHLEFYGGRTHYSNVIGIVEDDRVVRWRCPNCAHSWPRDFKAEMIADGFRTNPIEVKR